MDFMTVYNMSSWGYQDSQPVNDDGTIGGMIPRMLYRTLPGCYPADSAYGRFPFMVPQTMKGYLEKQVCELLSDLRTYISSVGENSSTPLCHDIRSRIRESQPLLWLLERTNK